MSIFRSPGSNPISRDAKYRVAFGSDGQSQIEIEYYVDERVFYQPSTRSHPDLVAMVCAAKAYEGGSFVINEWSQVIVGRVGFPPAYAGEYSKVLEFEVSGALVSAQPPLGLEPGEAWPGPSVGRAYFVNAGGRDISYKQSLGEDAFIKAHLSDIVGAESARQLASRLALVNGRSASGGRIYINECRQFFSPSEKRKEKIYLGALGDDGWFTKPEAS